MNEDYKKALKIIAELTDENTAKKILNKLEHLIKTYKVNETLENVAKYYVETAKKIESANIEREDALVLAYAYVENNLSERALNELPENYDAYLNRLISYMPEYKAVSILNKLLYSMKVKNLDINNQTAVNHVLDELIDIERRLMLAGFHEETAIDIAFNVVLDKLSYIYNSAK